MLMPRFACALIQGVWMSTCVAEAMRFKRVASRNLRTVQANVLREILANADNSEFARQHGFAGITSVKDFQSCVAVNDYEDLQPWIQRIAAGEQQILGNEKVLMFEETSGSTGGTHLIPYTSGLQQAFNRALHPWLLDLYKNVQGLWGGPAYWVVTPRSAAGRTTSGGVKIGFADDSDYFGRWSRPLINALMAVSGDVKMCGGGQSWRYLTALSLLRCEDLRLISLWNPTFFSALIRSIDEWSDELESDLRNGTCCPVFSEAAAVDQFSGFTASPMPQRAELLKVAIAALRAGRPTEFASLLWPHLAAVSSWTESEAASGAAQLQSFFPRHLWQTKGLLATEGAVTLPMSGAPAPVLAVRSAFFEFEEGEDGAGEIKLAHELKIGGRYRVIMTTFGGLYRYRLHDIVEMRGWWHNLPCLAFAGKEAMICDLCGEKLSTAHVKNILGALPGHFSTAFVAPEKPASPELPGYLLVASCEESDLGQNELAARVETALCENIHYRWGREAGQLQAARALLLPVSPAKLDQMRMHRLETDGQAISTAKLGVLSRQPGWLEWLKKPPMQCI
ncbi:MAG: GH3 auxin-responsive promoter family protein [Candidatus Riflebacteria bacterium]|nr:GH3 auxin-responsive promoter family protein [Candidatus Riflebacteria bacterium]